MPIIDNVSELFGDDLKAQMQPGERVRIAASTFSIFAFEALKDELEQVEGLDFIFTHPSFREANAAQKPDAEQRQFFIPSDPRRDSALYGSEFEIRLRNKLNQRAIARECAEWVRKKVTFRTNRTGAPMQSFAVVGEHTAYQPLQGFTAADLGYEQGPGVTNWVIKNESPVESKMYLKLFDQIWHNEDQLEDVTQRVHDHIASVYEENSPERVYFLILFNVFSSFLNDLSEDVLPNDRTGYQDTEIWKALYDFQRDAAIGIINKLETYNGCILADSVGLGKTFTALAVVKYYELRNKSVLVLAPKKLCDNWLTYNQPIVTNLFAKDRFNYKVLAHTDLSRDRGNAFGIPLDQVAWGNFDLVVIDESHNFRNADYLEERETRYQRLMRRVIQAGVKTKVLMLSATPVNNRFTDLRNQLALAYEGESQALGSKVRLSTSVEEVFRQAQRAFNEWTQLPGQQRTAEAILGLLDFDFFELLDAVTIARSRKHIQAFYDTSEVGAFPQRLAPVSLRPELSDVAGAPSFNAIFDALAELTMAVYAPLSYVFESRRGKYEELYGNAGAAATARDGGATIGAVGRESGVKQLMTVNLLKRLESSIESFRLTLERMAHGVGEALADLDAGVTAANDLGRELRDVDAEDDDFEVPIAAVGGKVKVDLADMDVESWRRDLEGDMAVIERLLAGVRLVTPEHDTKLQELKRLLAEKLSAPLNEGNRKMLVFSAFADTAKYLYRELAPLARKASVEAALVTGQGSPTTSLGAGFDFQRTLSLFSPQSKRLHVILPDETREIDLLIATDCISEGQNLQDCDYLVNYDIHWNPVRIIQRFGRIDRIGSSNERIQMVNFWPAITLDEYINLKERVENRMMIANVVATGDDNLLMPQSKDAEFRKEQLRKLQDEVIELEDVRAGISITDLGLNDFRMDLLALKERFGDIASSPKGIHAVVPSRPGQGLFPGVIFALRNVNADEHLNRGNRLHPYYLVYLGDDGSVIADHTQVRHLLDLVRLGAKDATEPIWSVCRLFNEATRDGAEMSKYNGLLTDAIRSMIEVTDERDIASLFAPGPSTALEQTIAGLDDFELIAFIAVVDEAA
ncbi:helicase-related protein [Agrococcus versicolor]|uniref:Helicase-related protein n=1 Tax=Agrococcus versicolor TaxID=501482 RepID=A0ABN3AWR3_9MICO